MKQPTIIFTGSGIGNRFDIDGEVILELNENLKKYPKLYHAVLSHEMGHTSKAFSGNDLVHDLGESKANSFDILKFMVRHPKSFSQLLPFYKSKRFGFVYDINLIILYSFLIIVSGAVFLLIYSFL